MSYPRGDVVLVDTNLFVSVGGVDHLKFRTLREFAEHRQLTLLVPQRVPPELSTMHIADRVERAVDAVGDHTGLIETLNEVDSIDFRKVDERCSVEDPHSQRLEVVARYPGDVMLLGQLGEIPDGDPYEFSRFTKRDRPCCELVECPFPTPLLESLGKELSKVVLTLASVPPDGEGFDPRIRGRQSCV